MSPSGDIMMSNCLAHQMTTTWIGTSAPINLLDGADIKQYTTLRTIQIKPATVAVTWNGDGRGPPGASCPCLSSTFTEGYKVAYRYSYTVNGYMYADPGSNVWMNTNLSTLGGAQSYYTFVPQPVKDYWRYGPDPATQIAVNGVGVPNAVTYNFYTDNWTAGHYPSGFTWVMNVQIIVSRDCTGDNLRSQVCIDICQADVDQCLQEYSNYCLEGDPKNFGDPICVNYYEEYIASKNSTADIDSQAIKYCAGEGYRGFQDLFESSDKFPDQKREADIPVCACYLSAGPDDPNATKLYDTYARELEKRIPSITGAGVKEKCLVPQCVGAKILPANIPAKNGGCPVPKCINSVVINNDGTINKLNISASCGGVTAAEAVVIAFLVIIVVLVLIAVYFHYAPARTVRGKSAAFNNGVVSGTPGIYMGR